MAKKKKLNGPKVACPKCGRKQRDRGPGAQYYCPACRQFHDAEPDEGGDYSDRNPAARLERAERRKR